MSPAIQLAAAGSILAFVLLFDERWVRPHLVQAAVLLRIAGLAVAVLLVLSLALQPVI